MQRRILQETQGLGVDTGAMDTASTFECVRKTVENLARQQSSLHASTAAVAEKAAEETRQRLQLESELHRITMEKIALAAQLKRNDDRWKSAEFSVNAAKIRDVTVTEIISKVEMQLLSSERTSTLLRKRVKNLEVLAERAAKRMKELERACVDRESMYKRSLSLEQDLLKTQDALFKLQAHFTTVDSEHKSAVACKEKALEEMVAEVHRLSSQLAANGEAATEKDLSVLGLQRRAADLQREVEDLQKVAAVKDMNISESASRCSALQATIEDVRARSEAAKIALEKEVEMQRKAQEQQVKMISGLESELARSKESLKKTEDECGGLLRALEELRAEKARDAATFAEERAQLHRALNEVQLDHSRLSTKLIEMESYLAQSDAARKGALDQYSKAADQSSRLQTELDGLRASISKERQSFVLQSKAAEKDLSKLEQLKSLEADLQRANGRVHELQSEMEQSSNCLAQLQTETSCLKDQLSKVSLDAEGSAARIVSLSHELATKEEQLQSLREAETRASKTVEALQASKIEMTRMLDGEKAKLASTHAELEHALKRLHDQEAVFTDAERKSAARLGELRESLEKMYTSKLREAATEAKENISKAADEFRCFQVGMEDEHAKEITNIRNQYEQKLKFAEKSLQQKDDLLADIKRQHSDELERARNDLRRDVQPNPQGKDPVAAATICSSQPAHVSIARGMVGIPASSGAEPPQASKRKHAAIKPSVDLDGASSKSGHLEKASVVESSDEATENCSIKMNKTDSADLDEMPKGRSRYHRKTSAAKPKELPAFPGCILEANLPSNPAVALSAQCTKNLKKQTIKPMAAPVPASQKPVTARRFGSASASKGPSAGKVANPQVSSKSGGDLFDDFGFDE